MITKEKQREAKIALDFLNEHPAFINQLNDSFLGSQNFGMYEVCKRGKVGGDSSGPGWNRYDVYYTPENYEKFKDKFDADMVEYKYEKFDDTVTICAPYEEIYGEPWEFDHMEYWYEVDFFAYTGDPDNKEEYYDYKNYQRYHGFMGGGNTFEDAIIEAAERVKKEYGDFNKWGEDFHTPEEIENNKNEHAFDFIPIVEEDKEGYSEMISNPKYILVSEAKINLRWLKWYVENNKLDEWYAEEFDKYIKKV